MPFGPSWVRHHKGEHMGKYMISASYTAEGLKGVLADGGTARRASVDALITGLGGSVEAVYWTFGGDDVVIICDVPSDEAVAAAVLTVGASGAASVRTTVLLTADQIDAAVKMSPSYRAPGA